MDLQAKALINTQIGLYIHVPFCPTKCSYCAFYQESPSKISVDLYIKYLEKELQNIENPKAFSSIYFGEEHQEF
jgi:oxygen-independent coproporphyrinogen-3 oxidase